MSVTLMTFGGAQEAGATQNNATGAPAVQTPDTMVWEEGPCTCEQEAAAFVSRIKLIQLLTIIFWLIAIIVLFRLLFR